MPPGPPSRPSLKPILSITTSASSPTLSHLILGPFPSRCKYTGAPPLKQQVGGLGVVGLGVVGCRSLEESSACLIGRRCGRGSLS